MKIHSLMLLAHALIVVLSLPGRGQTPQSEPASSSRVGQVVRSPEIHSDGRVTFRFRAPNAKEVFLALEGAAGLAMHKNEQGVWSVTTEALAPDLYVYRFVVDGVKLGDPANPAFKPVVTGGSASLVRVPGAASLSWEPQDAPRGTLHRHSYQSARIGEARAFWVYTPPGYNPASRQTYPVLYLLHGVLEEASAWTTVGQAHVILDNLIAARKAKPMLVVMPLGYGFANVPDQMAQQFGGPATQQKILNLFAESLLEEVIPTVERMYRVTKDRKARAIAGVSMGGTQALTIGLNHRERFAWVGSFSGAFIMYGEPLEKWFPTLSESAKSPLRLLWLACGTEDFLIGTNRKVRNWLKEKSVPLTAVETPGAHTWTVWRRHLTEFAPLLFR